MVLGSSVLVTGITFFFFAGLAFTSLALLRSKRKQLRVVSGRGVLLVYSHVCLLKPTHVVGILSFLEFFNMVFFLYFGRDNDLHRLLFMPNGLPDGTELAYYVKGQVSSLVKRHACARAHTHANTTPVNVDIDTWFW